MALGLLALAGALLAGSLQAGRAIMRANESHMASFAVASASRTALADVVSGWSSAYDSLAIGASTTAAIGPRRVGTAGLVALSRFRVLRLSSARFVVGLETSVGPLGLVSARRRLSVIIERASATDTSIRAVGPAPIVQWSLSDLF